LENGRLVCIAKEDPPKWGGTFGRRGLVLITKPGVERRYRRTPGVPSPPPPGPPSYFPHLVY